MKNLIKKYLFTLMVVSVPVSHLFGGQVSYSYLEVKVEDEVPKKVVEAKALIKQALSELEKIRAMKELFKQEKFKQFFMARLASAQPEIKALLIKQKALLTPEARERSKKMCLLLMGNESSDFVDRINQMVESESTKDFDVNFCCNSALWAFEELMPKACEFLNEVERCNLELENLENVDEHAVETIEAAIVQRDKLAEVLEFMKENTIETQALLPETYALYKKVDPITYALISFEAFEQETMKGSEAFVTVVEDLLDQRDTLLQGFFEQDFDELQDLEVQDLDETVIEK